LGEIQDWEDGEKVRMMSVEDGSGVGCAIIAAMEMNRRKMCVCVYRTAYNQLS